MKKKIWKSLDHAVHQVFEKWDPHLSWAHKTLVVGLSGGSDSMALAQALHSIRSHWGFQLKAHHVHHGSEVRTRELALQLAQARCDFWQIPLQVSRWTGPPLKSEKDWRQVRRDFLLDLQKDEVLVLAHHLEDLVETRVIRLIRGVTSEGITAMRVWRDPIFRPFLNVRRRQIQQYLLDSSCPYFDDPSNWDLRHTRNWVRLKWLPMLEKHRPGSLSSLALSLDRWAHNATASSMRDE